MDPSPQWFHKRQFAADALSAGRARRFVRYSLLAHDLRELVDDVELVVSELATNAMKHAGTPFTVTLETFGHLVLVVVMDGSPTSPHQGRAGMLDTTGRGMAIVGSLSRAWGVSPGAASAKSVWALFDLHSQ